MQLTVDGLPPEAGRTDVGKYVSHLRYAAERVSRALPETGRAAPVAVAGRNVP